MKQKGFAPVFLFILLGVVLVGGALYFFSRQESQAINPAISLNENSVTTPSFPQLTATEEASLRTMSFENLHWATYTNESLGIKLSYPNNYMDLREEGVAPDGSFNARILLSEKINPMSYVFSIEKHSTTKNLEDWWKDASLSHVKVIVTATKFKGLPAYYLKVNDVVQAPMDSYILKRNDNVISINFASEYNIDIQAGGDPKLRQTYEQVNVEFQGSLLKRIVDKILDSIEFI